MDPKVAIVGRPNVGKSTLFNRLIGARRAIVDNLPGVTRDRLYGEVEWRNRIFTLIDTGGYISGEVDELARKATQQAIQAIEEADLILFVTDARVGLLPEDAYFAQVLRRLEKPVFLIVNKVENRAIKEKGSEFHELGFPHLVFLSAEHGLGTDKLIPAIFSQLPANKASPPRKRVPIAVVGRVNVGKSTLVNTLLGTEQVVVSPIAGTTRDPIDLHFSYGERQYTLIDTAGIRRLGRVKTRHEHVSIKFARRSLKRAHIALVLFDIQNGVLAQDANIAGAAERAGCGIILVANKWDLTPDEERDVPFLVARIEAKLPFLRYAPVVFLSARTGENVDRLFEIIADVRDCQSRAIGQEALNEFMKEILEKHKPPAIRGRWVHIKRIRQVSTVPPKFVLYSNVRGKLRSSFVRYVQNQLRETFEFWGTPVLIEHRRG